MEQIKLLKQFNINNLKKIKFTKKKFMVLLGLIAAVLLCSFIYNKFFASKNKDSVNTAVVSKGEITVSVEGSGVIEPIEMYNIASLAAGDILQSDFEEGQQVKEGDLLYVIDTKDIENNIEKAKVSLEKQQLSHSQAVESYAGLSVTSPISGTITQCYVKEGNSVQKGTKIADIANSDYMILEIPFNSDDAKKINIGDMANVSLENTFYETTGTVQSISSGQIILSSGAAVSTVKIKIKNPGAMTVSDKATAVVNNIACNSAGTFSYLEQKSVTASASGEIDEMIHNAGDKIESGGTIARIESQDADVSLKQSELSLKDSELALQNTYDQLDNYNIKSPISGTVLQKTSKAGDTLDSTTKSTTMAVIADMSKLKFDIDVDELDIGDIELGQKVQVTADSLPGNTFEGTIENISAIGTNTDGVASYPVTVVMDYSSELMIGMNVNAEIVIDSEKNILRIPAAALYRNNMVLVKDEDGANAANQDENKKNEDKKTPALMDVPDGYSYIKVETGISNTDYVEITSGLEEGDIVIVPTEEKSAAINIQAMPGGGIPVDMPSGKMPEGGGGAPPGGM